MQQPSRCVLRAQQPRRVLRSVLGEAFDVKLSRYRSLVLVGAFVVGMSSACGGGRQDVEVQSYAVVNSGDALLFEVNSCNEESTDVAVIELDNAIVVTASTDRRWSCGGDDCSDSRVVQLTEPLGDRVVVDDDDNVITRQDF